MKFLLCAINAKYIHSNPAVYSLRAYAGERLRPYVEIGEYTINQKSEEILADIYKRKPEVIGFSCYIWNWETVRLLLAEIPKVLPDTDIWLGGPEVSFHAPELLKEYPCLTGIMVGEGEATFRELLEYYVEAKGKDPEQEDLSRICGLCLKDGMTGERALTDLDSLPFLYEDTEAFENRIIYYESSRGCPFCCSYCLSSIDKTVRFRNTETVKRELAFFLEKKVPQVKFIDRTFNCNHKHALEIWTYILEHDNGVTNFHFEISADLLNEEEIGLLRKMRPGLVQLEIGVQSVNPDTVRAICRVMDVEKLEQTVKKIKSGNNIHQHLDLIAGLPFEDYESFGRSFDRVYAMGPQQLQLGFLKVLKGSHMERMTDNYGIVFQSSPPYEVLFTDWLSYADILRLKQTEEMVEQYYNSNQFTHTLAFLEQAFESPFAMYESLAAFYEEQGYLKNQPARSYRYQILLSFARKRDGEFSEIYTELLTYDMYLRENLKSRPEFAKQETEFKEEIRRFYNCEETVREYLPEYKDYEARQTARMTHMEYFRYPVWDTGEISRCRDGGKSCVREGGFVLFDYKQRDPVTCEAQVQVIDKSKVLW